MFATVMLWAYTSFSQFLIIWSGNLSEEAPWFVLRISNGWQIVGVSLALLQFALPFFLLLMRRIKKDASYVALVGLLLMAMRFVDLYWVIAPPFHPTLSPTWMDLAAPIGLVGLWVAFFVSRLKAHPLMSPRQETAIHAALAHTQHQH
jgi:Ni/Fe-hydrogenase subunit HybB-like protein